MPYLFLSPACKSVGISVVRTTTTTASGLVLLYDISIYEVHRNQIVIIHYFFLALCYGMTYNVSYRKGGVDSDDRQVVS